MLGIARYQLESSLGDGIILSTLRPATPILAISVLYHVRSLPLQQMHYHGRVLVAVGRDYLI